MLRWPSMQLTDVFVKLGESAFAQLLRGISIGRLRTYQLYDGFKASAHLPKVNTELLRKAQPRFWARMEQNDEPFAKDLAQAILVSHLDLITAVLDFVGIPHENGFFAKNVDAKAYLTDGWQQRVYEKFREIYPEPLLLFYINHLAWELTGATDAFVPGASR